MTLKIRAVDQLPALPELEKFRRNPPDICLLDGQNHCGLWIASADNAGQCHGFIGHFHGEESRQSQQMLASACDLLRERGCTEVYGPMDGSTWKPYRFVTWSDGSPPFLMEPQNPTQWPQYWVDAGFSPKYEYLSTLIRDLAPADPRLIQARSRLKDAGISWRPIDLRRFEEELTKVYTLSLAAFRKNVLYTDIDQATFLQQYLPFIDQIDPKYVLLAHDSDGACCGFIFAIADLLQRQRGEALSRLIIKTLAVSSNRRCGGLGAVLVEEVQQTARQNGLNSAIHALMYSGNVSANIGRNSEVIRRYTLYAKTLS